MARALSMDLRTRIVAERKRGTRVREIAERFHVTERTIYNILRHQRKTGSLEPIRGRQGRKSRLIRRQREILGALAQNPHLTLAALQTQLALRVSLPALWRALRRWGLRLKKSPARRRAAAS